MFLNQPKQLVFIILGIVSAKYRCLGLCMVASPSIGKTVVVIGGGAAGYFGAIEAAQSGCDPHTSVYILEQGPLPLQKVKISGGGRCNVMHDESKPVIDIAKGYPRGSKQLVGPFNKQFGPRETADWFRSRGVASKVEEDGRMFPVTDSSQTIIDCLSTAARSAGVRVVTGAKVTSLKHNTAEMDGRCFSLEFSTSKPLDPLLPGVELAPFQTASAKHSYRIASDFVLLATGSSREGHALAARLGHNIASPVPSLFTFTIKDKRIDGLAGLSVQDCEIQLQADPAPGGVLINTKMKKGTALMQRGPVLITHSGISGPAPLKLSAFGARILSESAYKGYVIVNWIRSAAGGREEALEILRKLRTSPVTSKKEIASQCLLPRTVIPKRLWKVLVEEAGIGAGEKWGECSNAKLLALATNLAACALPVTGKGAFKDEFVTCGGVELKNVDMKTMASKIVPGLHFAGEVLDIDGITGGFNFQASWTTGWTAGHAIGQRIATSSHSVESEQTAQHTA